MNDGLARWSCGGVIDSAYASTIVQMEHMDIPYLTQIHFGEHSKWLHHITMGICIY